MKRPQDTTASSTGNTNYLVLDTESTVCQHRRIRILVSLAYEVVDPKGRVLFSHYDIVWQPPDMDPDPKSIEIHGITPEVSWNSGGCALQDVLARLFGCLEGFLPRSVVGHDVVGDINLLVSEAIRCGMVVPDALRFLVCTRMLATTRCAIPLPSHLRYPFPCDAALVRLGRSTPSVPQRKKKEAVDRTQPRAQPPGPAGHHRSGSGHGSEHGSSLQVAQSGSRPPSATIACIRGAVGRNRISVWFAFRRSLCTTPTMRAETWSAAAPSSWNSSVGPHHRMMRTTHNFFFEGGRAAAAPLQGISLA